MNTKFKKSIFATAGLVAASLALAGCASTANNGMAGMNHDMDLDARTDVRFRVLGVLR